MSEPIIRVENLGKKYRIQHRDAGPRYRALRDTLSDGLKAGVSRLRGHRSNRRTETEEFWALKDVSFDVHEGEVVGIIGRNGAGKSTLLKILSRITEPTAGRVTLNGRVASLLEVGTGFHPELTGRENIYLNGAILGMTRAEIRRKFDEIVDFAEVEKFLDMPVKRYSSGMYVRLAFAVAAYLDPEILVIDEVLAVGDAEFQKKCLGRMRNVAGSGRTVLFVSHNMAAIQALCQTGIYIRDGCVGAVGTMNSILRNYQSDQLSPVGRLAGPQRIASGLEIMDLAFDPPAPASGDSISFTLVVRSGQPAILTDLCLLIYSETGVRVAIVDLRSENGPYHLRRNRTLTIRGVVNQLPFVEGEYRIGIFSATELGRGDTYDLATLGVMTRHEPKYPVPYPPRHRGAIELSLAHVDAIYS